MSKLLISSSLRYKKRMIVQVAQLILSVTQHNKVIGLTHFTPLGMIYLPYMLRWIHKWRMVLAAYSHADYYVNETHR